MFAKKRFPRVFSALLLISIFSFLSPGFANAQEPTNEELLRRIEVLEQALQGVPAMQEELQNLRQMLEQNTQATRQAEERAVAAEAKAEKATRTAETVADAAGTDDPLPDTLWHLAGYTTVGAEFMTKGGGNDTFVFGSFNPVFHFQYKDIFMFEGELEFEIGNDGATEVALEYGQIDFLVHDNITLVAGKFLSPIGQFQERLHPTWVNKIGNAPAGFGHDGAQPEADVGVQVRGGVPIGSKSLFTYVLMAGNGPRLGHENSPEFAGFGRDDNQNKAFGGRIGFLPVPYLEIGGSFLKAKVDGLDIPAAGGAHEASLTPLQVLLEPTTADVTVWGADAAFTKGPWDFRFEYLNSVRDPLNTFSAEDDAIVMMPKLTLEAWYVQLAYRLSGIGNSPFLQKLEPVVRYGRFNITGHDELFMENAQKRLNIGLNYWLAPSVVARAGFERRKFLYDGRVEELILLQSAYGF